MQFLGVGDVDRVIIVSPEMSNFASVPSGPDYLNMTGDFQKYVLIPSYRFLVKVDPSGISSEQLAPLTDAGLTPYRAIKKVRHLLGPGKNIGIIGIGGLGAYAVQYANILSGSSKIFAFDINEGKLELASKCGADYQFNISNTSDLVNKIASATSHKMLDVIIDCVGIEKTIYDSISILAKGGALVIQWICLEQPAESQ